MSTIISHDSETPAKGRQVFTAAAFIHHLFPEGEKLFLPRRAKTKKFLPDVFELPGGHIDFGEEMIDGLIREVQEELHMNIRVGDPFGVFTYSNEIKGSHSIEVVYFAQFIDSLEKIKLNPEDHSEFVWVGENDLHEIIAANKNEDDKEIAVIKQGFRLLSGSALNF
ncbi:MAG: NUDIX hydrolase [Patescibacteria group bacterium]|jgi:8-oxo-dGTP pyrophosphatase MutT (NUDIX family)